ncbi:hypothetical protein CO038_02955 [Candidatus Pacearchaeota archaeon CG_4_9_14_0_2_um_filter_39_13]|nr:DUF2391 family protein [Candidatus Pacearchaeota archaeon]OIO42172.1 MAG: hypothetical protein AUJ64_04350 [Candidatus Pacearchaeota archaeon CG1_02_39_14]PJC44526.1 MAG: hypothetical protein CO038_02955 [Candidatus Pacearchaeota archaeon CG_4_9_14_0_2_um_filter_39_13]
MVKNKRYVPGFFIHDLVQVIIGATILAIPVGFTQEVWEFSIDLPIINIVGIFIVSVIFISIFTYYHYHNISVKKNWKLFIKRVSLTYVFSFITVCILLILIGGASLYSDLIISLKRAVIVTLPASMSAAIADTIK